MNCEKGELKNRKPREMSNNNYQRKRQKEENTKIYRIFFKSTYKIITNLQKRGREVNVQCCEGEEGGNSETIQSEISLDDVF